MKGVATTGHRGGTGKTTIAHLLALGASWKGVPAHFMHTDDREPIKVNGRPYLYYDARKPDELEVLINSAVNNDGLFVLDSGGNRPEFDAWVASSMDLVLMPVAPDPEDVRVALSHMARLEKQGAENVWFLINKVPANIHEKRYIARYLTKLPADRTIGAFPEMRAVRVLRDDDLVAFKTPPSRVNNLARNLYVVVNNELERINVANRSHEAA